MFNNHESLHVVQNSVQNIILERLSSEINDKIKVQKLKKRVPIFEKQKTRKFIPKIIETATFNLKIHEKTSFLEDHVPTNPMIIERKFRKSHNGTASLRTSQVQNNFQSKSNKLQFNIEPKRENSGEIFEPKLIKLEIRGEKEDEFILRKRDNFQRKEIIQKRLQTITESDKMSNLLSSINLNYQKQATSVTHSYTTDYNGDLIIFKSGNKQCKSSLKQQNLHEVKQEQDFPKQKSHIKVKITTVVENINLKSIKRINFSQIKTKNIQEIQRQSSDSFLLNKEKCNRAFQRKTSNNHDYLQTIKNLKLSPGVTLQSTHWFQEDKQNDACGDVPTFKLIGKLRKKSNKDIASDYPSETTKREIKQKKSYQIRPQFVEMQNVYE